MSPEVILAGRRTNESMGSFLAATIHEEIMHEGSYSSESSAIANSNSDSNPNSNARILVLGLTFKEDIPDLSNCFGGTGISLYGSIQSQ